MGGRQSLAIAACCCQPCKHTPSGTCLDALEEENSGALDFAQVTSLSVISWGPGSAPAGKLFEDTLIHLGTPERLLLLFASGVSLAAVRWLRHLGASPDVCDSNGSTCLHAACRSGALSVVMEFLRHRPLLEAVDAASWTPLHIAAHMGRRKVVVQLLRAKASPYRRNAIGQTPVQLCLDQGTREALCGLSRSGLGGGPGLVTSKPPRLLVSQLATSATSVTTSQEDDMPDGGEEDEQQFEHHGVGDDEVLSGDGDEPGEYNEPAVAFEVGAEGAEASLMTGLGDETVPASARGRPGGVRGSGSRLPSTTPEMESEEEEEDRVGVPIQCEPELFFVTPSPVVTQVGFYKKVVLQLAVRIFNLHPCYGVAFAVLSGLADNYTGAMKALLRTVEVDRYRAGCFLGDALSVCHLIRFGVLDSMAFIHTGVVGALQLAFRTFWMPGDLEKVHRLVHSVAVVWWRKHRALIKDGIEAPKTGSESGADLSGLCLIQYLTSSDVLSQLMFSTVMLHWFLHGDADGGAGRILSQEQWVTLNSGIEEGGADVPEFVQQQIYNRVARRRLPELLCSPFRGTQDVRLFRARSDRVPGRPSSGPPSSAACSDDAAGEGPAAAAPAAAAGPPAVAPPAEEGEGVAAAGISFWSEGGTPAAAAEASAEDPRGDAADRADRAAASMPRTPKAGLESALHQMAVMEGWLQLLGGALPSHAQARAADGTLGELTGSYASASGDGAQGGGGGGHVAPGPPSEGFVWASICCVFLLFAVSPTAGSAAAAPHAVADARRIRVVSADTETLQLTLEGFPMQGDLDLQPKIVMALLLPDGRWRELCIDRLELKAPSLEELNLWQTHIERTAPQDKILRHVQDIV